MIKYTILVISFVMLNIGVGIADSGEADTSVQETQLNANLKQCYTQHKAQKLLPQPPNFLPNTKTPEFSCEYSAYKKYFITLEQKPDVSKQ